MEPSSLDTCFQHSTSTLVWTSDRSRSSTHSHGHFNWSCMVLFDWHTSRFIHVDSDFYRTRRGIAPVDWCRCVDVDTGDRSGRPRSTCSIFLGVGQRLDWAVRPERPSTPADAWRFYGFLRDFCGMDS